MISGLAERGAVSTVSTMVWSCLCAAGRERQVRAAARAAHLTQQLEGLVSTRGVQPPTRVCSEREEQHTGGLQVPLTFSQNWAVAWGVKKKKKRASQSD